MIRIILNLLIIPAVLFAVPATAYGHVRIKDLADLEGMRENMLFGYGLVVGLSGTGDSEQVFFTSQSISSMLGRMGIRVDPRQVRTRNVAAVMVVAKFPTYMRPGSRIDVTVSSLGNARSLTGGVLVVTPLQGADGQVYAVAQGPVETGGFDIGAGGSMAARGNPTTGRIPGGAILEKGVSPKLQDPDNPLLVLSLKEPDITTAVKLASVVNLEIGEEVARAVDPVVVEIDVPDDFEGGVMAFLATIERLEVKADRRARIAVNERTGTVVAGGEVRIREVAISHGTLNISIHRDPVISQPGFAARRGSTVQDQVYDIDAEDPVIPVVGLPPATTVTELVEALNLLGTTPRDLIAILQAMKVAGVLNAELEVL